MKYSFNDIASAQMYQNTDIMFIAGQYNVFNNIVIDELKVQCRPSMSIITDDSIIKEFGLSVNFNTGEAAEQITNSVDFNTFMDVYNIPNINGKWFCSADFKMLTKKQKDFLDKYIKSPSNNGILVIRLSDWNDYKFYLKSKILANSKTANIIQLSFPNKRMLITLVMRLFIDRGVRISEKAAELFVIRMSTAYDDYEELIDKICLGKQGKTISYEEAVDELKGIDNYIIDDFLQELLKPIGSKQISSRRHIYKIFGALLNELGPESLVKKLRFKIDDYIEFRIAINKGYIPIKVRYSIDEVKNRLGNESKLYKISDFMFRRMAYTASLTSLRDWTYMKMIISNIPRFADSVYYEKVLYSLIHRTILNDNRLDNDTGLSNILDEQTTVINYIRYTEEKLLFSTKK